MTVPDQTTTGTGIGEMLDALPVDDMTDDQFGDLVISLRDQGVADVDAGGKRFRVTLLPNKQFRITEGA